MKRLLLPTLLTFPLLAQGSLFQEDTALPPSLGVQLQVGIPQKATDRDLNQHIGYGVTLCYPWHLGGRHLLRPNLEYNQYRISPQAAPPYTTGIGHSLSFHSWKLGMDYVLYQEPWVYRGPYVLVGVGLQHSELNYPAQSGTQQTLMSHQSSLTSPWAGAGFGYQFTSDIGLELRYSVAAYRAEKGQALTSYTLTEPIRREGHFIHLILALRAPF